MEQFDLYNDIAQRTGGEIYIGVVGPVRTGKSTFIKKFLDMMVLPTWKTRIKRTASWMRCRSPVQGGAL